MSKSRSVIVALLGATLFMSGGVASAHHEEVIFKDERGTTERLSISSFGTEGDGPSGRACLDNALSASDDGRFVVFTSTAGNLTSNDTNGSLLTDVFMRDRRKDTLTLVSDFTGPLPDIPGVQTGVCEKWSYAGAISGNGRYVAFVSRWPTGGDSAIDGDTGTPFPNVYLRDMKTGKIELVSRGKDGGGNNTSGVTSVSISDEGRFVTYTSFASNLADGGPDCNTPVTVPFVCTTSQVYVYDRHTRSNVIVSKSSDGVPANGVSNFSYISGNGRVVVFNSTANNLVLNDVNQCPHQVDSIPSCSDVFAHDLKTGETELVSFNRNGTSGNELSYVGTGHVPNKQPISDDGRFVLFNSIVDDLVPAGKAVVASRAYVLDRRTDRMERVTVSSTGAVLPGEGSSGSITDDGRFVLVHETMGPYCGVAVLSQDEHCYAGDVLFDRKTGQATLVFLRRTPDREGPGAQAWYRYLTGDGRTLVWASPEAYDGKDTNETWDVFARTIAPPTTGVGGAQADERQVAGSLSSGEVLSVNDPMGDSRMADIGSDMLSVTVASRPLLNDLFVAIEVDRLGIGGLLASPTVYGFRFNAGGRTYEARATSTAGGIFGLYSCPSVSSGCTKIADLAGGFGTTGERVVFSIPVGRLGVLRGKRLSSAFAFTAPVFQADHEIFDRVEVTGT